MARTSSSNGMTGKKWVPGVSFQASPRYTIPMRTLHPLGLGAAARIPVAAGLLIAAVLVTAACGIATETGRSGAEPEAPPDGAWISARDGVLLRVHSWEPSSPARGVVLMVPGVTGIDPAMELPVAESLVGAGFAVYALEPRGTGESGGRRGDAGSAGIILGDLGRYAAWGREQAGVLPVFLFGHSMGGAFALALAAGMEGPPDGLVLVNPAYKYRPVRGATPSPGDYLRYAAYWAFARHKPVVDMGGDPSLLEDPDDRAEAEERRRSSAVQPLQSMATMTAARKIMTASPRNAARLSAPGLLVEGERDLLIDPAGTDEIAAAWAGRGAERLRVDGAHGRSSALAAMVSIITWLGKNAGIDSF